MTFWSALFLESVFVGDPSAGVRTIDVSESRKPSFPYYCLIGRMAGWSRDRNAWLSDERCEKNGRVLGSSMVGDDGTLLRSDSADTSSARAENASIGSHISDAPASPPSTIVPIVRSAPVRITPRPVINAPFPNSYRKVNGRLVCAKKNDHPSKSKENKKGHMDMECCLDPDEIPNPHCYYPREKYEKYLK